MLIVKEEDLKAPDSLLDLVPHMLMVYWTAGSLKFVLTISYKSPVNFFLTISLLY